MNIWEFQQRVARRLIGLNLMNVAFGALLSSQRDAPFLRGVGTQAVGWAGINILLGSVGSLANRRRAQQPTADALPARRRERRNLSLLLWVNAALDLVYIFGGWRWAQRSEAYSFRRGSGIGVMLQGALLLIFDLFHVLIIPRQRN